MQLTSRYFKQAISTALFLLILVSSNAFANDWQDIQWKDYETARAIETDKPIFVFAELHFCGACKKMKNEVFNQAQVIELINTEFVPVNMKAFGIFPNTLDDLVDSDGNSLELMGSPALVVVYKQQYKVVYGFQTQGQLTSMLNQAIAQISLAKS